MKKTELDDLFDASKPLIDAVENIDYPIRCEVYGPTETSKVERYRIAARVPDEAIVNIRIGHLRVFRDYLYCIVSDEALAKLMDGINEINHRRRPRHNLNAPGRNGNHSRANTHG